MLYEVITWEKVIEIFVINERFDAVKKFIKKVIDAISELEYKGNDKTRITSYNVCYTKLLRHYSCRRFNATP